MVIERARFCKLCKGAIQPVGKGWMHVNRLTDGHAAVPEPEEDQPK